MTSERYMGLLGDDADHVARDRAAATSGERFMGLLADTPRAVQEPRRSSVEEVASNLELAAGRNPDDVARAMRVAQATGAPLDMAAGNLAAGEEMLRTPRAEALAPVVRDYMAQSPVHAALAKDDTDTLGALARLWHGARDAFASMGDLSDSGFATDRPEARSLATELSSVRPSLIGTAYRRGAAETEYAHLVARRHVYGEENPELQRRLETLRLQLGKTYADPEQLARRGLSRIPAAQPEGALEESFSGAANLIAQMADTLPASWHTGLEYAIGFGSTAAIVGQLGPQVAVPEEVITVPAAAGTGFYVGTRLEAARNMFEIEAGNMADELLDVRDENGQPLSPQVIRVAASTVGVINAALEFAQMRDLLQTFGGEALLGKLSSTAVKRALQNPSVRDALMNAGMRYGKHVGFETLMEVMQEGTAIGIGDLAKLFASEPGARFEKSSPQEKAERLAETARASMLTFALMGVPGGSVHLAGEVREARRGKGSAERLLAASEAAGSSQLLRRKPDAFEEFVARAMPEGEATQYLDTESVQEFAQSAKGGLGATLERLGVDEAEFVRAEEEGRAVAVSVPRVLAHFEAEERTGIIRKLRVEPHAMNLHEAEQFDPVRRAQEIVDKARPVMESHRAVRTEEARIVGELEQAGMPADVARQHGALFVAQARAQAERFGVDGLDIELLRRHSFRLADPDALPNPKGGSPDDGGSDGGAFAQAAMYRARDSSVGDFVRRVAGGVDEAKSFYDMGEVQRPDVGADTARVLLPSDVARHVSKRHQDFRQWEEVPDVVRTGEAKAIGMSGNHAGAEVFAFRRRDADGLDFVVLGAVTHSKNHGTRVQVESAFRDTPGMVENWIAREEKAHATKGKKKDGKPRDAGGSPALTHTHEGPIHESLAVRDSIPFDADKDNGETYSQPLNPGVDLDAPVRVVEVAPRFAGQNPLVLRKRFPQDIRTAVLSEFKAGVVNKDTGLQVGMSANDYREHFDSKNSGHDIAHLEAIAVLPELMRAAKLVESHEDRKTSGSGLKKVHRFMSALRVGGDDYAVKLTVKEFNDGTASLNMENPVKLYHHRIEKALSSSDTGVTPAMPTTIDTGRDVEHSPPSSPVDINAHIYSLRTLLEGVKDSEGASFLQGERGRVRLTETRNLVTLFKGRADLSTVAHEAGHIFLNDLLRLVEGGEVLQAAGRAYAKAVRQTGLPAEELTVLDALPGRLQEALSGAASAGALQQAVEAAFQEVGALHEAGMLDKDQLKSLRRSIRKLGDQTRAVLEAKTDIAALRAATGLGESEAFSRDAHERVARLFEAYLREGKAPVASLVSLMDRFRQWLTRIYSAARQLDADLSDEVRLVFDRMLATDEAITRNRHLSSILEWTSDFLDEAEHTHDPEDMDSLRAAWAEAERDLRADMDRVTLRDRKKRRAQYMREAKEAVDADPFWDSLRAISRGRGLDRSELEYLFGPEPVKELAKRRPGLVRNEGGSALDDKANELGYADGDTLWNEMYQRLVVNRETKGDAIRTLADMMLAEDDATHDPLQMFLAGDAYNVFLERLEQTMWKRAMRNHGMRTPEQQARYLDSIRVAQSIVRDQARSELMHSPVSTLAASTHYATVKKAHADLRTAWRAGNPVDELRAMERIRIATERANAVHEAQRRVESIVRLARTVAGRKRGTIDEDYHEQILRIVERYGLGTPTMRPRRFVTTILPLRDLIANDDNGLDLAPAFPDWLLNGTGPTEQVQPADDGRLDYRRLTPSQLESVDSLLRYLEHRGRKERTDSLTEERRRIESTVDACVAPLGSLAAKPVHALESLRRKLTDKLDMFLASQESLPWLMRSADGYTSTGADGVQGPNEQALIAPLQRQEDEYERRMGAFTQAVTPALMHFRRRIREWVGKYGTQMRIPLPEGGFVEAPKALREHGQPHLTGDMIVAMALNLGNEENMARLFAGYGDLSPQTVVRLFGPHALPVMETQRAKNALTHLARLKAIRDPGEGERALTTVLVKQAGGRWPLTDKQVATLREWADNNPGGLLDDEAHAAVKEALAAREAKAAGLKKDATPLFTAEDWRAVQQVWDAIDGLFPDLDATHKRINGFRLSKVQARGFLLRDAASGTWQRFDGGYYPARYDGRLAAAARVREWTEADDILNRNENVYQTPAAQSSMTKARTEGAPRLPLLLDTRVIAEHARDVIRYTTHAEAVRFADRVMQNPRYERAFSRVFGRAHFDALRPALKHVIRPQGAVPVAGPSGTLTRQVVGKARAMMVAYGLAYRFKAAATQLVAVFPAAHDLGWQWFCRGLAEAFTTAPVAHMRRIRELSPYMARRAERTDATLAELRSRAGHRDLNIEIGGKLYGWGDVVNFGLLPISVMDAVATYPVWLGAYKKHLAKTGDGEGAVAYADDVVRRTNPDSDPLSKSDWLRSEHAFVKMLNIFQSAAQQVAQRQRYHWRAMREGRLSTGGWGWYEMHDAVLPAIAVWLIRCAIYGDWGDDGDDDWWTRMFAGAVEFSLSPLAPVVGDMGMEVAASVLGGDFGNEFTTRGFRTVFEPVSKVTLGFAKAVRTAHEYGLDDAEAQARLAWSVTDIISLWVHVPASRVTRDFIRGYEQFETGEGNFLSPIAPRPKSLSR